MTWDDSLGNMRTLDQWRRSVGLVFDEEKPEALKRSISRLALRARGDHSMKYGRVEGIEKPISRLVMGSMMFFSDDLPFACAMLDAFAEMGGNCIDTANIYGGGRSERAVGSWLQLRDNRDQIVLIGKGAHTPYCTVENINRQIVESLARLQTDYVDLWLMHRDNADVPVGDFVECLNENLRAGRVRAFGVSNWTITRIDAANAYAREHGLTGFAASSPNLSLAVWNEPQWSGCVTASDSESLSWYEQTQTPLFSWSSQAKGFFTGRFRKDDRSDTEIVRVWFNDENFRRLERAEELAGKKGVTATQIAVAYVLCQPFPTFALIGPQSIEETRTSAMGLDVELSAQEMKWLVNGESARVSG
jgi:aryl-alcohol dehydrogenase-like predicted oxidoreductase